MKVRLSKGPHSAHSLVVKISSAKPWGVDFPGITLLYSASLSLPLHPLSPGVWALVSDSVGRVVPPMLGSALSVVAEDKSPRSKELPVQWACFQASLHQVTSAPQVVLRS